MRKFLLSILGIPLLVAMFWGTSASAVSSEDSIRLAYHGLLHRAPSQSDIDYWRDVNTVVMLDSIVRSQEFKNGKMEPVDAVYLSILGRSPSTEASQHWNSMPSETAVSYILGSEEVRNVTGFNFKIQVPSKSKSIERIIVDASNEFRVSPHVLTEIIRCESGFDPNALNASNREASGLAQHMSRFWRARAAAIGTPDASIFDPVANARAAAWLLSTEGTRPWLASKSCHGF